MSDRKRIYQIAIELNISHSDIIDFLDGIGEPGYGHMSEINGAIYSDEVPEQNCEIPSCISSSEVIIDFIDFGRREGII